MLFGKKKMEEKKKPQTPADVFFDGMEEVLKTVRKTIAEMDTMKDIDKTIKLFSKDKKLTQKEVYQLALYGEEMVILEMIYDSLISLSIKNIEMPEGIYDVLLDDSGLLHDRAMKFTKDLLDLRSYDENKRIGFNEIDIIGYKEMYEVIKKRIAYIRGLAAKKGFTEKDIEMQHSLYAFDVTFKEAIAKNTVEKFDNDKREMMIVMLKAFPEDTFNRKGLCPIY